MRAPEYHWLAFDCEAVAISEAKEYLEPVTAPGNYKDQVKIDAYVEAGTKKALADAALDVDLARIVAIGYQSDYGQEPYVDLCRSMDEEIDALRRFWGHIDIIPDQQLVGFYVRRYDLPLLIRRSQLLGVSYPDIDMDRYRSRQVIDLHDRLTFNGAIEGKKLTTYCKRFGIAVDDDVTGADIAALVEQGVWDLVAHHVQADVRRVVAMARAIGAIHVASTEPVEVL